MLSFYRICCSEGCHGEEKELGERLGSSHPQPTWDLLDGEEEYPNYPCDSFRGWCYWVVLLSPIGLGWSL